MEGSKFRIIIVILLLGSLQLKGSYRTEIYSAYISDKMDLWRNVIERMEAVPDKSNEFLVELVNYQYGYIGYCIGFDKKEEAKKYFGISLKNIEILEKRNYNLSVINSYKSAFYGFRIFFNPITAPVNGHKSIECAKTALQLDPGYYLGYIVYGSCKFNTPSSFGGSKKEALEFYLKAKELIEKNPEFLSGDWNYMNLLITIAKTYTDLSDYVSAKRVYETILELEPGFIYVKADLYPKLLIQLEK